MNTYNKIMLYFWLLAAIVIFLVVSYMTYMEGVKKWGYYYVLVVIALMMFFFKKWMMNRMEKHLKFLEEKRKTESHN